MVRNWRKIWLNWQNFLELKKNLHDWWSLTRDMTKNVSMPNLKSTGALILVIPPLWTTTRTSGNKVWAKLGKNKPECFSERLGANALTEDSNWTPTEVTVGALEELKKFVCVWWGKRSRSNMCVLCLFQGQAFQLAAKFVICLPSDQGKTRMSLVLRHCTLAVIQTNTGIFLLFPIDFKYQQAWMLQWKAWTLTED